MSGTYEVTTEQDQIVIRVHAQGADREVKDAAWQRVRHLFEAGGSRG